jgi:hypothetical protein
VSCAEWCRLLELYRAEVTAYEAAVKALNIEKADGFNEAWGLSERKRLQCEYRRSELLHHEHDHECFNLDHHSRPTIDSRRKAPIPFKR